MTTKTKTLVCTSRLRDQIILSRLLDKVHHSRTAVTYAEAWAAEEGPGVTVDAVSESGEDSLAVVTLMLVRATGGVLAADVGTLELVEEIAEDTEIVVIEVATTIEATAVDVGPRVRLIAVADSRTSSRTDSQISRRMVLNTMDALPPQPRQPASNRTVKALSHSKVVSSPKHSPLRQRAARTRTESNDSAKRESENVSSNSSSSRDSNQFNRRDSNISKLRSSNSTLLQHLLAPQTLMHMQITVIQDGQHPIRLPHNLLPISVRCLYRHHKLP